MMRSAIRNRTLASLIGMAVVSVGMGGAAAVAAKHGRPEPEERRDPVTTRLRQEGTAATSFQLASSAFEDGEAIPRRFSCQGADRSPPLSWTDVPEGASSLALIVDDPDAPAGTWVHWVIYDIPASLGGLPEGMPGVAATPQGARQGINDFRRVGYGGPCPPAGKPHRYFFKLYALDIQLDLPASATKEDLLEAMDGHVLADSQLMGRYERE